ncbi:MAG: dipeptide epimerase [Sphingomonas sp.]|nr:dipeptide epimerase [Sphingomonas sp.]
MMRRLTVTHDVFALTRPFRISRGSRSEAEVVTVMIEQDGAVGRGECTPYPRYGESIASTMAVIEGCREMIAQGGDRQALRHLLPAGAARNAIDCALWDLEGRLCNTTVAELAGLAPMASIVTGITISIDTPEAMAAEARTLADVPLLKIKVDGDDPMARIDAVRAAAPVPRLIVDPNESWSVEQLVALQDALAAARVDLLEQPIPAALSAALFGLARKVPICADEAAHSATDIPGLVGRYDYVNLKLDKTGGLTEALDMAREARDAGLGLMVGCMLSSSLAIAPAALLAQWASFIDLDGPYLFEKDRDGGFQIEQGYLRPTNPSFWG